MFEIGQPIQGETRKSENPTESSTIVSMNLQSQQQKSDKRIEIIQQPQRTMRFR